VAPTLRLGTCILILPQRNPVVLAKELASLDVVSGGRLIFGVGAGYLEPEFDAIGVRFGDRGRRTDEYIDAIRCLWTEDAPSFRGPTVAFSGIQARPLPVQKPHPPIVVGGMSPAAFRRAALRGNGWYGFALDLDGTKRCLDGLRAARAEVDRPAALGELEISVSPSVELDADLARRFEDLGVHRLVPLTRGRTREELVAFVEKTASALAPAIAPP
jgi:probable F420-dependent oxidoreductase